MNGIASSSDVAGRCVGLIVIDEQRSIELNQHRDVVSRKIDHVRGQEPK